jgi:hypothetical protein
MDSWMVVSPDSLPSPAADSSRRFWVELFRRACAVDTTRPIIAGDTEMPGEERVLKGYQGTPAGVEASDWSGYFGVAVSRGYPPFLVGQV